MAGIMKVEEREQLIAKAKSLDPTEYDDEEKIYKMPMSLLGRLKELHPKNKLLEDVYSKRSRYNGTNSTTLTIRKQIPFAPSIPSPAADFQQNDIGNGKLFAEYYKNKAVYVLERKAWAIYTGRKWEIDISGQMIMGLCKELATQLIHYETRRENPDSDYIKFLMKKWLNRSSRETIIKDAASENYIKASEFDKNPYLLNVQNGTLDIGFNTLHKYKPHDYISKIANVEYDPTARSELWEKTISEIMENSTEKIKFLQKAMGYALTGDTSHECFFILYGATSRNGKSTICETFSEVLGDYAKTARPETIAANKYGNGSRPNEDIARLAGARFVNMPEPDKNMALSASLVKTLTGNDTITARFLHENSTEYKPQFKLFMNTNHLPTVSDPTLFASGRVLVIPFTRHFAELEQNRGLKKELLKPENKSSILNWCIEGWKMLNAEGFIIPKSVRDATEEYRHDSDKIGRFVDEMLMEDARSELRTKDLYDRYKEWCEDNGHYSENAKNFKSMMLNYGQIKNKRPQNGGNSTPLFIGYRWANEVPY